MNELVKCVFNCMAITEGTNKRMTRYMRYQNGQNLRMLTSIMLLTFGFMGQQKRIKRMEKEVDELKNTREGE